MNILGPNGTPMVAFGDERAWLRRVIRDVVCSYQWLHRDDIDPDGPHPCMCLYPATRRMDTGAYVIPQRNAWAFADNKGNPTPHLLGTAFKIALQLGFDRNDRASITRAVDIITEGLPDLIRMPSDQHAALEVPRPVYGMEATAKINGKTIVEQVL